MKPLELPADRRDLPDWLKTQEERLARKTRQRLRQIIVGAYERWLGTLTAAGDMAAFDSIIGEWQLYVDDLMEELGRIYLSAGIAVWDTTSSTSRLGANILNQWIEVVNTNAVDYAASRRVNVISGVGDNLFQKIQDLVTKSIQEGTSSDKLRAEIEKIGDFAEYRADMIARTETSAAFNNGDWESMQALGEFGPVRKYWIPTNDAVAREWHLALAEQPSIPIDEPFDVDGEAMMYPQDPGASAYNCVNCRCVAGYLFPGDTDPVTGELIGEAGGMAADEGAGLDGDSAEGVVAETDF